MCILIRPAMCKLIFWKTLQSSNWLWYTMYQTWLVVQPLIVTIYYCTCFSMNYKDMFSPSIFITFIFLVLWMCCISVEALMVGKSTKVYHAIKTEPLMSLSPYSTQQYYDRRNFCVTIWKDITFIQNTYQLCKSTI